MYVRPTCYPAVSGGERVVRLSLDKLLLVKLLQVVKRTITTPLNFNTHTINIFTAKNKNDDENSNEFGIIRRAPRRPEKKNAEKVLCMMHSTIIYDLTAGPGVYFFFYNNNNNTSVIGASRRVASTTEISRDRSKEPTLFSVFDRSYLLRRQRCCNRVPLVG